MNPAANTSRRPWLSLFAGCACVLAAVSAPIAQQTTSLPQPRASALPPPATAAPNFGRGVPQPAGVMPKVPAGFTVSVYAELQAPRMMAYAPNGDLFVSSPNANRIWVLRDATNDGVVESCSIFAEGPPPGAGRRGGGPPPTINYPAGCAPQPPPAPAATAPAAAPPAAPQAAPAGAPQAGRGAARAAGAPPQAAGGGGGRGRGPAVLGAEAPACTPPAEFVERGPGELGQPFGLA